MVGEVAQLCMTGDTSTPVVLTGPPRSLRGRISVANTGGKRGVLRDAVLTGPVEVLGGERVRQRLGTTVLRPDQEARVPISLSVDPHTAPGEYELELAVGEDVRTVVLRVVEDLRVAVRPGRLVLENRPGETVHKQVFVANGGNVPLTIGALSDAVLDDELFECRSLRRMLAGLTDEPEEGELDDERVTVARLLTEYADASRHVLDRAGRLVVRNAAGTTVVAPGDEVAIPLEIDIPETLSQHTRYHGTIPIYTADLAFVVVPVRPEDGKPAAAAADD